MPDDVTTAKPLRGGRQKANHIQVHRLELGKWERENLLKPLAGVMDEALAMAQAVRIARMAATLAAAGAAVGISWSVYAGVKKWTGFTEGFTEALGNWWRTTGFSDEGSQAYKEAVEQANQQYRETGQKPKPTLEQTWNFWVGGLIPYPF